MKGFLKSNRKLLVTCLLVSVVMSMMTMTAFASTGNDIEDIGKALQEGFADMVSSIIGVIAGIIPVGLTIFGLSVVVGYSIKFFKKLVGAGT